MMNVDQALGVAALTRSRVNFSATASVLANVAPQLAIQTARLIETAMRNVNGKMDVTAIISPENAHINSALALAEANKGAGIYNKPSGLPNPGSGGEAEQTWGSLGDIEFDLVSSPNKISFSGEDEKYAQHDIIGAKSRLQWTGQGLQTLKLDIVWYAVLTPDIEDRLVRLTEAKSKREVLDLFIGDSSKGSVYAGTFVITSIPHTVTKYNPGSMSIAALEATINLLEWVDEPDLVVTEVPPGVKKQGIAAPKTQAQIQVYRDGKGNLYRDEIPPPPPSRESGAAPIGEYGR
jgi:phage protein U